MKFASLSLLAVLLAFGLAATTLYTSPARQDENFKEEAAAAVAKIEAANPRMLQEMCAPGKLLPATKSGLDASCTTVDVEGPSQIYAVTVQYYPSHDASELRKLVGVVHMTFDKMKNNRPTEVSFQRIGGGVLAEQVSQ